MDKKLDLRTAPDEVVQAYQQQQRSYEQKEKFKKETWSSKSQERQVQTQLGQLWQELYDLRSQPRNPDRQAAINHLYQKIDDATAEYQNYKDKNRSAWSRFNEAKRQYAADLRRFRTVKAKYGYD